MSIHNHPDTETLSAFLDGEAPEVEGHVASCAECRQELDALARVRSAVGAPVRPPDENRKDTAIAAAVRAMAAQSSGQNWRWRLVAGVGAAAAVIVIGVVVSRVSTSHDSAKTASGPVSSKLVRGGDLGDVGDALVLRERIQPGLAGSADVSAAAEGGAAAPAQPKAQAASPTTAQPQRTAAQNAPPRCEAQARKLQPNGVELVYEATARWQGTPADVFGFSPPGAPATSSPGRPAPMRVYVLARSDCRLLVFQSYAP